jgi:hypothetical protein
MGGDDVVFHLHGLEDEQGLTDMDAISPPYGHGDHGASTGDVATSRTRVRRDYPTHRRSGTAKPTSLPQVSRSET